MFLQNVDFFPMKEVFNLDLLKFQFGIMCGIAAQEPDARPPGAVCALHFLGWLGTALMDVSEDARRVGRDQVRNVSQHGLPAAIHLGSGRRIGLWESMARRRPCAPPNTLKNCERVEGDNFNFLRNHNAQFPSVRNAPLQ